jgi:hypothetical protein
MRDRLAGTTARVSVGPTKVQGKGSSTARGVSGDGRYVAIESYATNFVAVDTNPSSDIFRFDRATGLMELASVSSQGEQGSDYMLGASISRDGAHIVFSTCASLAINDTYLCGGTGHGNDLYVHDFADVATTAFAIYPRTGLDFVDQVLGSATTQRLWLKNKGTSLLAIDSITLRGTDQRSYLMSERCPDALPGGGACAIDVTFAPTTVGTKDASVRVVAGGVTRWKALTGNGVL